MTDAAEITRPLRTGWEPDTPSSDTLALAGLRAMTDRATAWATAAGGQVRRSGPLTTADAGSPCLFLNVAVSTEPIDVDTARAAVDGFAPERPFLVVSPHPSADLRPAGLQPVGHPPFMARPAGGGPSLRPAGVDVTEVTDAATLTAWDAILSAGYPAPLSPAPPALLGGPARFWLAHVDGEPVATALSWSGHGVVAVEAIATLPDHRGRGVGAAITAAASAADPGRPAVLIASDPGVGVYRRLGYLPLDRWTLWWRP